ncbi:MAG: carbohydrate ABC transporter substrate-binding protein [Oscillospiraceae bacterium]|nr:carbohydrate ABC transporter substrate-binding protein [Oscillospiraceae bacterium]
MRKMKAVLASMLAAMLCLAVTGCGTGESSGGAQFENRDVDAQTREELAALATADARLTGELENKTIKWLSDWPIDSEGTGKTTPIDLAIFQERYGANIQWYQCTYEQRYDQLANYINSDEGIDFFYAGNFDAFPKGAIKKMFVPFDEYIDLDSELWKDVKDINDSIAWKDGHYMAVVQMTGDNCAVMYNRDTVAELGFEDPVKLFEKGEWDWNKFQEMLEAFVDLPNQKYGLDGWWFESALSATTGVPYIGMENGQLVNNLSNGDIERVQNYMYGLNTKGLVAIGVGDFGWTACPQYIGEGKELFYPIGLWDLYNVANETNLKGEPTGWQVTYGENCMFVPMPKDPEADDYYIPAYMESYCLVKGGGNPEGVARYLDCKRLTLINEDIRKISDQQFRDDYKWTDEMLEMKKTMDEMAMEHPVIDFKNGINTDLTSLIDDNATGIRASAKGILWNETLSALKDPVQTMLDEANNS